MTKGEIAKRIGATLGAGLLFYLASYGPVMGYTLEYVASSPFDSPNRNRYDNLLDIYTPLEVIGDHVPACRLFLTWYAQLCWDKLFTK